MEGDEVKISQITWYWKHPELESKPSIFVYGASASIIVLLEQNLKLQANPMD